MKKIFVNRKPYYGCWGGGAKFYNAIHELALANNCVMLPTLYYDRPDSCLIVGLDQDSNQPSAEAIVQHTDVSSFSGRKNTKLVLRVNENDARKNTDVVDKRLIALSKRVDSTIFVSNWMRDYFFARGWACKDNTVIVNGVDKNYFHPGEKLNNGKINIVTAHWSDNALKGQDYVEFVDDFVGRHSNTYTYTYIGRTKANLKHTRLIHPLDAPSLGTELSKYDVCINATRWDPGPNSVIETIACGVPTYVHKEGGGAVEFAGKDHVFYNIDDVEDLLLGKSFVQNATKFDSWESVIGSVCNFIS